jgi:signal transduction histidine kinase
MSLSEGFKQQPRAWILAEMAASLLVIGVLDLITSYKFRLLPFYAPPIFGVAWFCGARLGILAAVFSTIIWWCANWFGGDPDLRSWIQVWETGRHSGFFLLVALTGSALRAKSDIAAARIALLEHSQRLEHEIVNTSEAEQRRIGQDLHDGLCQYLAALSCSATSLRDDLQKLHLPAEANKAGELATLLQDAVLQTRDLARGLVPGQVVQLGLALALESLAQSITRLQGVSCTFRSHGRVVNCDEHVATHLYRIAQEAINNAVRHGKARNIAISLELADHLMTLRVLDDGVGIAGSNSNGMGLPIMRYRARLSGGELRIEQPKTGGTIVSCTARTNREESETAPT